MGSWTAALIICCCGGARLRAQIEPGYPNPYTFTTFAGGYNNAGHADGAGGSASFFAPWGVAIDPSGNIFVTDTNNGLIRKVTAAGDVTTYAGMLGAGFSDGPSSAAQFFGPMGVVADSSGNIFVADLGNSVIRKITPAGQVTTFAGTARNYGYADGTGPAAVFDAPAGLAIDASNNIYVADSGNEVIRVITPAAVVTTLAGSPGNAGYANATGSAALFYDPQGIAVDGSGNVYVSDYGNEVIRMITSAGVVSTVAGTPGATGSADGPAASASFWGPEGVAVDSAGNIYVADSANDTIRQITSSGTVSTLVGNAGFKGGADGTGSAARFNSPVGLALDSGGDIYVGDAGNNTVRKIAPGGIVTTLAGTAPGYGSTDGNGLAARFFAPNGVAVDANGNAYVADTRNSTIRKMTPAGNVTTLAGTAEVTGSVDATGSAASFKNPFGVAVDANGNVYVGDTGNNTIREISTAGAVTTLAGTAGTSGSADATGAAASFNGPSGVAVDNAGNVYVADKGNCTIRKVTQAGVVTTLAGTAGVSGTADGTGSSARFNNPEGVAVDSNGNVYIADSGNGTIRVITPLGSVSTLAGEPGGGGFKDGTGSEAIFWNPTGLAVDGSGNVFVVDSNNGLIREVTPSGTVTTLAGTLPTPTNEFEPTSSDGSGGGVRFDMPSSIALIPGGGVYVTDTGNNTIRLGFAPTPTPTPTPAPSPTPSPTPTVTPTPTPTPGGGASPTPSPTPTATPTPTPSGGASPTPTPTPTPTSGNGSGRLINLSCRAQVGTSGNVIIAGFVIGGAGTSGSEQVLVRGSGPALGLAPFNLPGVLSDPKLTLTNVSNSPNTVVTTDTGWGGSSAISNAAASVGAFPWNATSVDSAVFQSLPADNYTAEISGASNDTGVALVEVYDATPAGTYTPSSARLINLSARVQVGTGANVVFAGFVIGGTGNETVLIRASGPALGLAPFNIPGVLPDPQLTLTNVGATPNVVLATNAGWGGSALIANAAASVGAFPWSTSSKDSAILVTLPPGNYTAGVQGASGDTGVALIEVYEVQ